MAGTIITECPACFTRFKVTPGQLRLAGGKVRCGACLLVFKAGDPPPEAPKVAPYNPNPDVDFGDVDLDLPDSDHDQPTKTEASKTPPGQKAGQKPLRHRESVAQKPSRPTANSKTAAARSPVARPESSKVSKAEKPNKQSERSSSSGTPKREVQATGKQQPVTQDKTKAAQSRQTQPLASTKVEAATAKHEQKAPPKVQTTGVQKPSPPHPEPQIKQDSNSNPLLDSLAVESIEFSAPRPPKRPLHTTAWVFASTFAVLLLAGQYFWFERHALAWQAPWHELYRAGCEVLKCQLPTRQLVTQIRSQQMLVQDHPEYQEALLVQLILENEAQFDQPWPALELAFTDLKGRAVAQRRFQPTEYLDTDTVDLLTMPTGQPSQIQLEIMKPGTRAVSYVLSIVKPDPAK